MGEDETGPPNSLLNSSFKNAANSIAVLYREALSASKKAQETGCQAGYQACLQDLWTFLSQESRRETVRVAGAIPLSDLELFIRQKYELLVRQEVSSPRHRGTVDTMSLPSLDINFSSMSQRDPGPISDLSVTSPSATPEFSHRNSSNPTDRLFSSNSLASSSLSVGQQQLFHPFHHPPQQQQDFHQEQHQLQQEQQREHQSGQDQQIISTEQQGLHGMVGLQQEQESQEFQDSLKRRWIMDQPLDKGTGNQTGDTSSKRGRFYRDK